MTTPAPHAQAAEAEYPPVRVHLVKDDTAAAPPSPPRRPRRGVQFRTIVLTTTAPVRNILGYEPARAYVLVQALGNDVVLAPTEALAQTAADETASTPNPDGFLLSHANTVPVRLDTTEAMWASAAAYPAQVTIAIISRDG